MESSIAVANFFVQKSFDTGVELTPMKVVKLVYIAHGWHLALYNGEPLINEVVQAWKYGPVVDTVYREFSKYRSSQITQQGTELGENMRIITPSVCSDKKELLEKIWSVYGQYNGLQLSTLTHQENTPWDIVWNKEGGSKKSGAIIRNSLIEDHYKEKIVKK